ncbi:hypothetical protein [Rickettsia endosymbiont of Orchestes rusci]|uniref:hypothetical protein n=1 Tax=Rickettsia endosymbiont of Orchestes rusci TaxID=3066250 RepID=UPI00313A7693
MAHNLPHYSYYKYGVIPRPLPRYPEKALIKRLDAVVKPALLHGSKIAIFWVFFKSTAMSCRGLTTASSQAF